MSFPQDQFFHKSQVILVLASVQCLVVSDSLWPCGLQPTGLLSLWDSQARTLECVATSFSRGPSDPGWGPGLWCLLHWQVDSSPPCRLGSQAKYSWEGEPDGKRSTRQLWKPSKKSLAVGHPVGPQRTRYQHSLIIWEMNLGPKQEHFRTKNILVISLPLFTCWILRKYLQKLNQFVASVYFVAVECRMHVKSYSVVFLEKYS